MIRPQSNAPKLSAPIAAAITGLALLAAGPVLADEGNSDQAEVKEMSKGEQRLAKMLEGREAGAPLDCITTHPSNSMVTIADTAYVYGRGNVIYVQRTEDPEGIDRNDVLVTRRHNGTRLCRLDIASTVDRHAGFFTGNVRFAQFVPYTRVKD